ncbi:LexA family transcriptional regulator [Pseudomonas sp. PSKL.D1]|uniref:LexA family transcriptional regulator n=1 Tax=Pseudomonas sp. PSKL.D1 TaxID=3029060 RepID=UPI002380CA2F|nr:S24 family peptidase [Pseudomonas sp. PSKL.D1]WDY57496.1 S24 family peptidase [Pseudomonas sp. PSKL.D1]
MKKNSSGDRLRALLRECGLTPSDFAAQRRITPQHVNNWFRRGVPLARIDELADLFCVHRRWLRCGEGPKYPSAILRTITSQEPQENVPTSLASQGVQLVKVPYHEIRDGLLVALTGQSLRLPNKALRALGVTTRKAICLSMPADNMAPLIPRDALLAIDLSQTKVIDGETYALLHNGEFRVNRLSLGHSGTLCLHSHDGRSYSVERYTAAQRRAQKLVVLGWVFHWSHFRHRRPR